MPKLPKRLTKPIKYHGGKYYLANQIIKLFPPHIHYVESYFGGGSVLFAKPAKWIENHSEVVNDLNSELMNFWCVIGSDYLFPLLVKDVQLTPFSEELFNLMTKGGVLDGPIIRAHAFFIRYRQSRQGLGKDFATVTRNRTRRGMNEQVSAWLGAVEGLPEAHERLKRVLMLHDDALKVIESQDGENTFFYLDPPYPRSTRTNNGGEYGEHEMTDEQHADLLVTLRDVKGKFILSGYRNPMYDKAAKIYGWRRIDVEKPNSASSAKEKEIKIESLWLNYNPLDT